MKTHIYKYSNLKVELNSGFQIPKPFYQVPFFSEPQASLEACDFRRMEPTQLCDGRLAVSVSTVKIWSKSNLVFLCHPQSFMR